MSRYISLLTVIAIILGATPAIAQPSPDQPQVAAQIARCVPPITTEGSVMLISPALNRAKNLARQAAERINGGLANYRAEAAMHGPSFEAPCVDNGNGTWTFTFTGSKPGSTTPVVESVVTVAQDASKVTVNYNGPIRNLR